MSESARRVADLGREAATKTTEYVREGIDRATDYAQNLSGRITELTGRPPEAWGRQLREFVEHSPVKALVIAVGVGYLLGRTLRS